MKNKKKIIVIITGVIIIVAVLVGITLYFRNDKKTISNSKSLEMSKKEKDVYYEVLNNEREYIEAKKDVQADFEDTSSVHYKDSEKIKIENKYDLLSGKEELEYNFIEFSFSKEWAMLVKAGNNFIILKYSTANDMVYGLFFEEEQFIGIKNNGVFKSKLSDGTEELKTIDFIMIDEKIDLDDLFISPISEVVLAKKNADKYEINGSAVTKEKYESYLKENYDSSKNIEYKKYKINQNKNIDENNNFIGNSGNEKNDSNISSSNGEQEEIKEVVRNGNYVYTYPNLGMEVDGSSESINLVDGKITFKMNYFSKTKVGTYVVNGDKLIATYTSEELFDQSQDKMVFESISEVVTYNIVGDTLRNSRGGIDYTYTKK